MYTKIEKNILKNGGIGVMRTDTLYGLVGSVFSKEAIKRIYILKKRNFLKPLIVLIHSINELKIFDIKISKIEKEKLMKIWPGKTSVVLNVSSSKWSYINRNTNTIAFRIPDNKILQKLLKEIGPLVAPSANIEGESPAKSISQAYNYFGDSIDFYVDGGVVKNTKPSKVIKIKEDGSTITLR